MNERTRQAWADPHNKSFYVPASFRGIQVRDGSSRESTPFQEIGGGSVGAEENEPELRISLNSRPKDISKGWMFGRDRSTCDVYCGECDIPKKYNIGRQTFSLTISKRGELILKHVNNQNQTEVHYSPQKAGTRQEFIWIMFPECEKITVTSANRLQFKVIVTKPDAQTELYKQLCTQYLNDAEKSTQSIPSLSMDSGTMTAANSLVSRPKMRPFYYRREGKELGRGAFGKVEIVVDASTGIEYAGKTFFGDINQEEIDILAKQKHVSQLVYFTTVAERSLY